MATETHVPVDQLNANLRALGRSLADATILGHGWSGGEYGLHALWPDGFQKFIGFGAIGSAVIESWARTAH